jgi:hypothetical protein
MINYYGGVCIECGEKYDGTNACIFHFHHRDESTKKFAVGNQVTNKSWNSLIKEADKCDMLCANCHEKKHSEEF